MKTYRIGVIGLGQRIAHVLAAMKEVGWSMTIAGYLDPEPVGLSILEHAGIDPGHAFSDKAAFAAAPPFDLVMVATPNHLHLDYLKFAWTLGCPVFAEKPIVRTMEETVELAGLIRARPPGNLFIGLVMRSMPIVRETIARIDAGAIGEIISIDATEHLGPEHGAYLARNWRRRRDYGGSFMLDKVCHDFDIFGRLVGARPARVASFGGRRIFHPGQANRSREYDDGTPAFTRTPSGWAGFEDAFASDMDVADHQTAMVEYENGVALSFHSNSQVSLQERRWYIAGTEGTLIADLVRNKLMLRRVLDRGKPERIDFSTRTDDGHNGADQEMARDLLNTLENGAPFPVTPEDSMVAGLTVMAIDKAMDEKQMIDCAPMWAAYDAALKGSVKSPA